MCEKLTQLECMIEQQQELIKTMQLEIVKLKSQKYKISSARDKSPMIAKNIDLYTTIKTKKK